MAFSGAALGGFSAVGRKEVLKDTVMSNGKKYAVISVGNLSERDYQRVDNDSLFQYSIYTHRRQLLR